MEWGLYLLKVSACMALFFAIYYFLLRKLTFFSGNRYYLLFTLVLSFLIPVLHIEVKQVRAVGNGIQTEVFDAAPNLGNAVILENRPAAVVTAGIGDYSWTQIVLITYTIVAVMVLLVFVAQLIGILKYCRNADQAVGSLKIVYKSRGFTNCSFFKYVFIDVANLTEEEIAVIIKHECIHALRAHTVDKLIMMFFKAVLWFNPIVYLYGRALEQVHEYEADQETSADIGSVSYANLLLNIAVKKSNVQLVHNFVQDPLKARMKMLFTNPSKNMKKLIYLPALPLGLGLVWVFSVQVVYADTHLFSKSKTDQGFTVSWAADKAQEEVRSLNVKKVSDDKAKRSRATKAERFVVPNDTVRLVGRSAGSYPKVTIDGQDYDEQVLTWISPRCIKSISTGIDFVTIETKDHKIESATEFDRENARIAIGQENNKNFFIRYPQKDEDGKAYEMVRLKFGGTMGSSRIPKNGTILILIEGKVYSEAEAERFLALNHGRFGQFMVQVPGEAFAKANPEYGKYDAVFHIASLSATNPF